MTRTIDLRSDAVTKPTPEMRRAMAEADVGDDVYREDPSVNRLEEHAATLFNKPAALFVPSGTMGNQIAIRIHTQPGEELICEARSHVYNYEMGAMAAISGCQARPFYAATGHPVWADIEPLLSRAIYFRSSTGLIVLENTHNYAGGTVADLDMTHEVVKKAHERGIPVHLDGARIFNAATARGCSVAELAKPFDSVMFCLSKGLCAPVGSLLLGSHDLIAAARHIRKMLGGGMRQAGVLAAAGSVALSQMPQRLRQDHRNAKHLAQALNQLDGFHVDLDRVQSNIVLVDLERFESAELCEKLRLRHILAGPVNSRRLRLVTHKDVSRAELDLVLAAIEDLV